MVQVVMSPLNDFRESFGSFTGRSIGSVGVSVDALGVVGRVPRVGGAMGVAAMAVAFSILTKAVYMPSLNRSACSISSTKPLRRSIPESQRPTALVPRASLGD